MKTSQISEHLPGEPTAAAWPPLSVAAALLGRFLLLQLLLLLVLPLLPPYLLLRPWMGRPPQVPSAARWLWHLRKVLGEQPPAPGLPLRLRLGLLWLLCMQGALIPLFSLAWYLDRILYGRKLDAVRIEAPFFELSAGRSGSTQLAHYLEEDPQLVAPNVLQFIFPYLWLWKLAPLTLGRLCSKEQFRAFFLNTLPSEYLARHEMDPFRTDTFEVPFLLGHLWTVSSFLGPELSRQVASATAESRWTKETWEEDLPEYIDALGRKVLLRRGSPGRLMIKGHFLGSVRSLERRYPDARFLTMIRDPEKRIQSAINFHRCQPGDSFLGSIPWAWLVGYDLDEEIAYCDEELRWYQEKQSENAVKNLCVIRFEDYRKDLEGSLKRVYQDCLGSEPDRPLPREHASRKRSGYQNDRSLPQLGIDPECLRQRLCAYRAWCEGRT